MVGPKVNRRIDIIDRFAVAFNLYIVNSTKLTSKLKCIYTLIPGSLLNHLNIISIIPIQFPPYILDIYGELPSFLIRPIFRIGTRKLHIARQ